jgi:hypothetical protein
MLGLIWTVIANVLSINEHNNEDSKDTSLVLDRPGGSSCQSFGNLKITFPIKLQGKLPRIAVDNDNSSQKMS